jgi:hypothetical protein
MDTRAILVDDRFTVPAVRQASEGVAWLRSHLARFSEGDAHQRRRRIVDGLLAAVDPADLTRTGDHVATLAQALGLPRSVASDVRIVARCYQPHNPTTATADQAITRLVDAAGGHWDDTTANLIGVLVQSCDATARLIAGQSPPVPTTRRMGPDGRRFDVDLTDLPFGAGRHACPGREHALALADSASRSHRRHDGPDPLVLPDA